MVAFRGVLGEKQANIVTCSGGVVRTQLHHYIEGTKVLRATIWVMSGMLRRAAQAYLKMDRKGECINVESVKTQCLRTIPNLNTRATKRIG